MFDSTVKFPSKRKVLESELGQCESFENCYVFLSALKNYILTQEFLALAANANDNDILVCILTLIPLEKTCFL